MITIVTTPDEGHIGDALSDAGAEVTLVEGPITSDALREAGIDEADLYVLTDPGEATSIPLVRETHPDVRIVVYASDGIPDFATHQADLVLTPGGVDRDVIVEGLLEDE